MNIGKLHIKILSLSFPYILFVLAAAGFIAAYYFFGNIFAFKSLAYVIPFILAAVILLFVNNKVCVNCGRQTLMTKDWSCQWCGYPLSSRAYKKINKTYKELQDERRLDRSLPKFEPLVKTEIEYESDLSVRGINFIHFVLINILLFIISIILLISYSQRPWAYFIIIALISGLIFIQILYKRPKKTDYLILFEIILVSLNLIWGVTLKYPLYFGGTDILGHLYNIQTVLDTAHTTSLQTDLYYPLFHIFNAIGIDITGTNLRTGLFLYMGIAWEVGTLLVYFLFTKFSNSRKFSLIACLLFAGSSIVIVNGMYTITRSLAFVLIAGWTYLILNYNNAKYIFLAFIVTATLILTHHTTIFLFIPILLVVYISKRVFQKNISSNFELTFMPIMVLTICFFAYMLFIASDFSYSVFAPQLSAIFKMDISLNTDILHQQQHYYLLGYISDSLVLFLSLVGIGIAIKQYAWGLKNLSFVIIGLPSLLFLTVYFSNISQLIPQSKILLFWRLPILVSFFIIYMTTYGLSYFMHLGNNIENKKLKKYSPILSMLVVVAMSFFFLISPSISSDVNYIQKTADVGTSYFTTAELEAFSFVRQKCNYNTTIYGDYETLVNKYNLNINDFLDRRLITTDLNQLQDGYLIFRSGELQKSGGLNISLDGSRENIYRYNIINSEVNIQESLLRKDCIYTNNKVNLFVADQNS